MSAAAVAFLLGSMPFAVWLGRLVGHCDVRDAGDGNPGTANAFKAAGWRTGVPTLALELGKAGVPVGVAHWALDLSTWGLVPVALAPIFGHAFSPFLAFRGGKAIAATFGSWAGVTGVWGPAGLAVCMGVCYGIQKSDAWTVTGGFALFGILLLCLGAPLALLSVWFFNFALVVWKHRGEFAGSFAFRGWVPSFKERRG
jgi:glycerol-3-phosphate acyltransferase PlsY